MLKFQDTKLIEGGDVQTLKRRGSFRHRKKLVSKEDSARDTFSEA